MNTLNKSKYKTLSTVFGCLTLVWFLSIVVCYIISKIIGENEESVLNGIVSIIVVMSAFLFLIFAILFMVFRGLRKNELKKKIEETSQLEKLELENDKIVEHKEPLYTHSSSDKIGIWPYMKGIYYSNIPLFYVLIVVMLFSYAMIYPTVSSSTKDGFDLTMVICLIVTTTLLFQLVYLYAPLVSYFTAKKQNTTTVVEFYDDRISVKSSSDNKTLSTNGKVMLDYDVTYRRMIKARKDKSCFYFNYLNDKRKNLSFLISYLDLDPEIISFLDKKAAEVNHK